ncbi:PLD nuclease N-terminal domain-containing protein [Bacillus swezeyi]|uniref:Transcriptional regulator n=1 Tax=Bacillus swezeyi TaxID=1925020 RepID=A0A1R1QX07_9BACI|nr:PLD nuclease N-terminal domain-containing protein [Bacillus swezeyi]MEC1259108.1 PLD nuclease N-terminal domain-containing protein [Bacillus swezeyi]MED2927931.1 PLD nuclease N-terminal domain-containing protein [Bacillus swezeyi]MED2942191.1 PLD nuclease N-terminal domain-containing protein [Bacillus swezeyi]MED2965157.1 PLD nuclease N-terminal domain-containing protein [Bacillus swezeyi]MED2977737.1 PLD nuclease N-terminal domain-containing protein [Bacillus swezeyi]
MAVSEIPWSLIAPLIVLYLILVVSALVNCLRQEETNGPKWLWVLIIAGISFIGPISYFVIGKKTYGREHM